MTEQLTTGGADAPAANDNEAAPSREIEAFTFGEPESVLDRSELLGYVQIWQNGRWYEPPVSMNGLTKAFDLPGPHGSCIRLKTNLLLRYFRPSRLVSAADFEKFVLDYLALGNAYFERRSNRLGGPLRLAHSLARYTRRGVEADRFFFVPGYISPGQTQEHEFELGSVFHLQQFHVSQEVYGVPEFLPAMQAGLLGEAATLFRRRYYVNGSHAGFVFYLSEETISEGGAAKIKEQLKRSKGVGNFKNLFIHAPAGKKDGVQIIPISEVAAKDEFLNVKQVSLEEMLMAHRTPPQLLGIIPKNSGGFGDPLKAIDAFQWLEIAPLMKRMLTINEWLGVEAIAFDPLEGLAPAAAAA
jgi:PBSX family phage portal protein